MNMLFYNLVIYGVIKIVETKYIKKINIKYCGIFYIQELVGW